MIEVIPAAGVIADSSLTGVSMGFAPRYPVAAGTESYVQAQLSGASADLGHSSRPIAGVQVPGDAQRGHAPAPGWNLLQSRGALKSLMEPGLLYSSEQSTPCNAWDSVLSGIHLGRWSSDPVLFQCKANLNRYVYATPSIEFPVSSDAEDSSADRETFCAAQRIAVYVSVNLAGAYATQAANSSFKLLVSAVRALAQNSKIHGDAAESAGASANSEVSQDGSETHRIPAVPPIWSKVGAALALSEEDASLVASAAEDAEDLPAFTARLSSRKPSSRWVEWAKRGAPALPMSD